jgi:hypothetical protein
MTTLGHGKFRGDDEVGSRMTNPLPRRAGPVPPSSLEGTVNANANTVSGKQQAAWRHA